jgi:hypothetical protein
MSIGSNTLQGVRAKRSTETQVEYDQKCQLYNSFKAKGAQYAASLEKAIGEKDTKADRDEAKQFGERYETKMTSGAGVPSNVMKDIQKPGSYTKVDTGIKGKESAYQNYASPDEGTIIGGWNYANRDVEGPGRKLPNSEVLYQQYKGVGGSFATLGRVIRSSIANEETMVAMDMCAGTVIQKNAAMTYQAGSDNFNALLGTDNCKGVAFMLTDHARESGGKRIAAITMYPDHLVLTLS